jgi:hypothetical protein
MFRKALFLFACVSSLAVFAGCGGGGGAVSEEEKKKAAEHAKSQGGVTKPPEKPAGETPLEAAEREMTETITAALELMPKIDDKLDKMTGDAATAAGEARAALKATVDEMKNARGEENIKRLIKTAKEQMAAAKKAVGL